MKRIFFVFLFFCKFFAMEKIDHVRKPKSGLLPLSIYLGNKKIYDDTSFAIHIEQTAFIMLLNEALKNFETSPEKNPLKEFIKKIEDGIIQIKYPSQDSSGCMSALLKMKKYVSITECDFYQRIAPYIESAGISEEIDGRWRSPVIINDQTVWLDSKTKKSNAKMELRENSNSTKSVKVSREAISDLELDVLQKLISLKRQTENQSAFLVNKIARELIERYPITKDKNN